MTTSTTFNPRASPQVLLCTVGGSHRPIVTAIRDVVPTFVSFLCTGRDPVTGQPGSRVQVEGKGSVIKAHPNDPGPTLPNIPRQCELAPDACEVRVVPADDLDGVVAEAARAIADLKRRFPGARLLADYTGGTKTMTAGLVMAALGSDDVELRLMTGARGDLAQVHDGTERSTLATVERVRLHRAMGPCLAAWKRYGYGEAAEGLAALGPPRQPALQRELQIAQDLSRAFDAWDRFDHGAALSILNAYRARIGKRLGSHLGFLQFLVADETESRREPARLWDLWLNAERRAAQGRYDDAVARAYRLIEWTAQWLLRVHAGIDTSNVSEDCVPGTLDLPRSREGRRQAGLFAAWQLVGHHLDGAPGEFARAEANAMRDHLQARNDSILAHGYTPVAAGDWERFGGWIEAVFTPMLQGEAARAGLRRLPPQLPRDPPWME